MSYNAHMLRLDSLSIKVLFRVALWTWSFKPTVNPFHLYLCKWRAQLFWNCDVLFIGFHHIHNKFCQYSYRSTKLVFLKAGFWLFSWTSNDPLLQKMQWFWGCKAIVAEVPLLVLYKLLPHNFSSFENLFVTVIADLETFFDSFALPPRQTNSLWFMSCWRANKHYFWYVFFEKLFNVSLVNNNHVVATGYILSLDYSRQVQYHCFPSRNSQLYW